MNIETAWIEWPTTHRWTAVCPSIDVDKQVELHEWCRQNKFDFLHIGVRFWFVEQRELDWFVLRWS
jgi:hypothetical protein